MYRCMYEAHPSNVMSLSVLPAEVEQVRGQAQLETVRDS